MLKAILLHVFLLAGISGVPAHSVSVNETKKIAIKVIENVTGNGALCPSQDVFNNVYSEIANEVNAILQQDSAVQSQCGPGAWTRVAFINMTDTSYQCPDEWELTSFSKRTCARTVSSGGCNSATFSTRGKQYSRVCGQMIGYQYAATSAFLQFYRNSSLTIDDVYCDGVSLTHGLAGSREHIWTFAAGYLQDASGFSPEQCPCDTSTPVTVPTYVGSDYFCESGAVGSWQGFHPDDPLWDGMDCLDHSTCCSFNNPPWFTKELRAPTTDDLEARICDAPTSNGVTAVEFVELYVL